MYVSHVGGANRGIVATSPSDRREAMRLACDMKFVTQQDVMFHMSLIHSTIRRERG